MRLSPWLFGFQLTTIAVVFRIMVHVVQTFDLSHSNRKVLMLVFLLTSIPALLWLVSKPNSRTSRNVTLVLSIICTVLLCWHFFSFALKLSHSPLNLNDIATTTLSAIHALLQGKNPYTLPIDTGVGKFTNAITYDGYKYLPMMAVIYMPLGAGLGERGILTTNLLLDLATFVLVYRLGSYIGSTSAGLFASALYLMQSVVTFEIFIKGSTDLAGVVPLLLALLSLDKNPGWAGFCVGLSVSTKLLPGAVFIPCCLPSSHRGWYAAGVMLGLIPTLVFLILSPAALIKNTVLFNSSRLVDSTTWMYEMPPEVGLLARAMLAVTVISVSLYVWFKRPTLELRCGLALICLLGVILSGPIIHRNYHLWWVPMFAVLLGSAAFRHPIRGAIEVTSLE